MATVSAAYLAVQQQPRITNILFPTDFSPCSKRALPYATALAKQHRAMLHLINVAGPYPLIGPLGAPYVDIQQEDDIARRQLETVSETPEIRLLRHECSIHRGAVWDVVHRLVQNQFVDFVVMATHGRRGVRQFVLGSVTEQVFRTADCPVLTIGPGASPSGPANGRFSTIIAALDLSPGSHHILGYARLLATTSNAALVLLHAVPSQSELPVDASTSTDDAVAASNKRLRELVTPDVSRTDVSVKIGSPAEIILQTAEDRNADLIVIGARRGIRLAAHNPWAVAHEVVCGASCPVLTVGH